MNESEVLIGIAGIATSLAGFTGVVVVFGSRREGNWHPGDRLRLGFLLEASLTGGGFGLLALILSNLPWGGPIGWASTSAAWAVYMVMSLYVSRQRIRENLASHGDVDRTANHLVAALFSALIVAQLANALLWHEFTPLLAALTMNLAGAAMQFARLIRSAFQT
jgi:hypothetical protein